LLSYFDSIIDNNTPRYTDPTIHPTIYPPHHAFHHTKGFDIEGGLTGASNIIFSQGLLDPWHGGGFLRQWDQSMPVLLMKNGAHHLGEKRRNGRNRRNGGNRREGEKKRKREKEKRGREESQR
jgi:hypothetical protein